MARSKTTLLEQLSVMEPTNLRDLLNFRQELAPSAAVSVASEKRAGRTLLDIILQENEAESNGSGSGVGIVPEAEEGRAVRVSLMTLLALTEREGGEDAANGGGGVAVVAVAEDEEAAAPEERAVCCVCLARRRGAAFIPCGHTFCRACSRELWTGRGSCPLCNGVILDILDIF